jgi:hypothetical protein
LSLLTAVLTMLCGCVPVTQIQYTSKQGDIRIAPGNPTFSVSLATPTLDPVKHGEIDLQSSFARNSQGKRFSLLAKKNPEVEAYPDKSFFLSRELLLLSASGNPRRRWPDGQWSLHLERVSGRNREIYDAEFRLSTLLWTPFLGPPN